MARKEWTKEQEEYLMREFYNYTKQEIADHLGKSKNAIAFKHQKMLKKNKSKKKTRVYMTECFECGNKVNEVESGYFCLGCLAEFDKYGRRLAPIYMDGI